MRAPGTGGSVLPPAAYPVGPGGSPQPYSPTYSPYLANPYAADSWTGPAAAGGVYVELRSSSRSVRIDRVLSPGNTFPVCFAPCRQVLPRDGVYVIAGEGVRVTSQFVLPDDRDRVVLDVNPGSSGQLVGGVVLAGGGLLTAYLGLLVLAASSLQGFGGDSTAPTNSGPGRTVGGSMMVGGLLAGLLGLYFIFDSKTKVSSSTGSQFTNAPAPAPKHGRFALTARGLEF
jgi:hypothetical protein